MIVTWIGAVAAGIKRYCLRDTSEVESLSFGDGMWEMKEREDQLH